MADPRHTFELLEAHIIRLTYHVPVTAEVFQQATEDRVRFAAEHGAGPYVLIVDYSQTTLMPSALNPRLNTWSARLDSNMLDALLISRSTIVITGASLVRRITGRRLRICASREEALTQARLILKQQLNVSRA